MKKLAILDYTHPYFLTKLRCNLLMPMRIPSFHQKWILVIRFCQKPLRRFHESSSRAASTGPRGRVKRIRRRERGERPRRTIVRPHLSGNCGTKLSVPKDTLTTGTSRRTVRIPLSNFFLSFFLVYLLNI